MVVIHDDKSFPALSVNFESAGDMVSNDVRDIHVATINVRFDGMRHNPVPIPPTGVINPPDAFKGAYREQPWAVRRSRLVDALLSMGDIDIVGFQEVYKSQLEDLHVLLGKDKWGHVGVGRDDGKEAGEYSPIFYDKTRFEKLKWKTIWLSSWPEKPGSIGWDASQTRIATFLSLKDKQSGCLVHAVCTHYDHMGVVARAKSSLLIRGEIRSWVDEVEVDAETVGNKPKAPVILFGDFNSPPKEDGYKYITSFEPLPGRPGFTFLDAYCHLNERRPGHAAQSRPYGPDKTYTGFAAPGKERTTRIDFVMMATDENPSDDGRKRPAVGRGGWRFTQYACIDNWVEEGDVEGWQGRWSDHRAVRATLSTK